MNLTMVRGGWALAAVLALAPALCSAQQSASYKLEEHDLNEGGHPSGGAAPSSASYKLTLDAIGSALHAADASSASYKADAGFVLAYPPPGEALNILWTDKTTFVWTPERSVGDYNVYRGLVSALPGGYGSCLVNRLPAATASDPALPPAGDCFFYLVTAENRIDEEGTKGYDSLGSERPNAAPCP